MQLESFHCLAIISYEPLNHALYMVRVNLWGLFTLILVYFSIFRGRFFNETIFPFPLIGYEMIIARSTLPASLAINQIIQRALVE